MFIKTAELAEVIQTALKGAGYHKPDIEVKPVLQATPGHHAYGDGYRAKVVAIDLNEGKVVSLAGNYGGANPFTTTLVDDSMDMLDMVPHVVLVKLQSGGTDGRTFGYMQVHPDALAMLGMLDSGDKLDDIYHKALYCFISLKGGEYRRDELKRRNVPESVIQDLVDKGFLKVNKAGAVSVTTEGKNAYDDKIGRFA